MNTVYEFRYVERDDCVEFRKSAAERFNIRWMSEDSGNADAPLFIFKHFVGRFQRSQEMAASSEYGCSNVYHVFLSKVVRSHQGCGIRTSSIDRKNKLGDLYFCYGVTDDGCLIHSCAGNANNILAFESIRNIYKKKIPTKELEDELREMKSLLEQQEREIQKLKENNEQLLKERETTNLEANTAKQQLRDISDKLRQTQSASQELQKKYDKVLQDSKVTYEQAKTAQQQLHDTARNLSQSKSECKHLQEEYRKGYTRLKMLEHHLSDAQRELAQVKTENLELKQKHDTELKQPAAYSGSRTRALRSSPLASAEERSMLRTTRGTTSTTVGQSVPGRAYQKKDEISYSHPGTSSYLFNKRK